MTDDNSNEEEQRSFITRAYAERLATLKKAQELSRRGDTQEAVKLYSNYLNILANHYNVNERDLSPKHLNKDRDITEILLISHAYWDLAKAYDRSPTLGGEARRCLDQFVKFTIDQKFHHLNSRMVRKFINGKRIHHLALFEDTYKRIKVESKACFIATYAFGTDHPITNDLRSFRDRNLENKLFQKFLVQYYELSPVLVFILKKNKFIHFTSRIIFFRPLLKILTFILKKCSF